MAFSGTGSTDPESGTLTYAWDFDGNGTDDATGATTSFTYTIVGTYVARLRVTDPGGLSDSKTVTITVGNTPPVPTIDSPTSALTYAVGDPIPLAGGATDQQDGTIPASRLSWSLIVHHCPTDPNNCHTHMIQTIPGDSTDLRFVAPDHEYPSWLEVALTATDSGNLTATTSVRLDPKTVTLSFATVPSGLQLTVGSSTSTTPFTRTVVQGSRNTVTAPTPQTLGGAQYTWTSWSDGGARSHDVIASASGVHGHLPVGRRSSSRARDRRRPTASGASARQWDRRRRPAGQQPGHVQGRLTHSDGRVRSSDARGRVGPDAATHGRPDSAVDFGTPSSPSFSASSTAGTCSATIRAQRLGVFCSGIGQIARQRRPVTRRRHDRGWHHWAIVQGNDRPTRSRSRQLDA